MSASANAPTRAAIVPFARYYAETAFCAPQVDRVQTSNRAAGYN
jgi:hypothetical protein